MNYKKFSLLKICFLLCAFVLAIFLLLGENVKTTTLDHNLVFVLDVNRTMNTQDVSSGMTLISRLDAAKHIIQTIIDSEAGCSYGLVIFNGGIDYIVPATFDTGTFMLYLSSITTNLLAESEKHFTVLTDILIEKPLTSYIVLSDFDVDTFQPVSLPKNTQLIGLGSSQGDYVRYSNGIRYYASGASVSSIRNDSVAAQFHLPYTTVQSLVNFSPQKYIFGDIHLPLSQRMFLYVLLGILVLLGIML